MCVGSIDDGDDSFVREVTMSKCGKRERERDWKMTQDWENVCREFGDLSAAAGRGWGSFGVRFRVVYSVNYSD